MHKGKKIGLWLIVVMILCGNSISLAQTATEQELWQQIQVYANPVTEDKAALKNCYA